MSSGPPDAAASMPPREEEDEDEVSTTTTTRRRIAYPREFLVSVGASSEACRRLPFGFDASKLSELSLVETGSRGHYVAPFARCGDACSSGSANTESRWNQLDRHPGNQCRHNWQSKEHDGLLGSGTFPRIPCYAGTSASSAQGTGYQLPRNAGGYKPTRQYQAPPVSQKNVDLINTETSGSFENWNKDRVEEERKRRASFELIRKEQHRALQEQNKAPDSDKENLGDGIIFLLHDSAGKGDPPNKRDMQGGLKVSSLCKEDATKAAPLLPTPTTSPLKPLGFTNGLPQKRLQIQSFNTSHNSEIQQLNTDDIMESSSICAQRFYGGGILGSGHADTLVECDNSTFSGSTQEGLEIHLPEEDDLFSVNDFSYTQNTDQWSAAECARAVGLPPKGPPKELTEEPYKDYLDLIQLLVQAFYD